MSDPLDRRRNAIRDDLADVRLAERVARPRYAKGTRMAVAASCVPCRPAPDGGAVDTELLFGEPVDVFSTDAGERFDAATGEWRTAPGLWSWVQSAVDGYVGYVPTAALAPPGPPPTHVVAVPSGIVYRAPSIKRGIAGWLPLGAAVHVVRQVRETEEFGVLGGIAPILAPSIAPAPTRPHEGAETFMLLKHLRPIAAPPADWVAIATLFVGAPYVWGGKTWAGIDCSGLVQLALQAAGRPAPRDSDMQAAELGEALPADATPTRGDLLFWKGHVGIMSDGAKLLHANGHAMTTVIEPAADVVARLAAIGLEVTVRRRPGPS